MRWRINFVAFGIGLASLVLLASAGTAEAPIRDPVLLNIGLNCRWEVRCIKLQEKAMRRALAHVAKGKVPPRRMHRCNRNAARARARIDWVGFDHCIRNRAMGKE